MARTYSILGDSPVDATRDCLNFGKFVTPFAARLIQSVDNTPFTVGILADWGQGKSTVMRMLKSSLEAHGCATAWFEPWKYTGREAVWKGLALTLVREINANDSLRRELRRKKDGIRALAARALWSRFIGRDWAQDLVDTVKTEPWSPSLLHAFEEDFEGLFEHIRPEAQGEAAKPFVLFVDDLDRCLPESALAVLEAMKLVLNRPGLITVMGVSPRELSRAVSAAYARETKDAGGQLDPRWGDNYMEKVIQMPFPLPIISDGSLEDYVGTCLTASGIEPGLGSDVRWRSIIRETCGGNLRQVKRFLNHLIAEMDKADANERSGQAQDLDARRVAFTLLLGWRFPEFLTLIRQHAADRDLLVRYQLFFSQQAAGTEADASLLQDPDGKFHRNPALVSLFNVCFSVAEEPPTALVVPFANWEDLQPYLQFGLPSDVTPSRLAAKSALPAEASPAPESPPWFPIVSVPRYERVVPPPSGQQLLEYIGRVGSLMSSRSYDEALREADGGLAIARTDQDNSAQAVLLNAKGEILEALRRPEAATVFAEAFQMAERSNSPVLRTVLVNLSRSVRQSGGYPHAILLAEQAANIAREMGDTLGELTARIEMAETRARQGDLKQAEIDYRELLTLVQRVKHTPGELIVLERLAHLLRNQGRDNEQELSQADVIAMALNDRRASARLQLERGILRLRQSNGDRNEERLIVTEAIERAMGFVKEPGERSTLWEYVQTLPESFKQGVQDMQRVGAGSAGRGKRKGTKEKEKRK